MKHVWTLSNSEALKQF